MGGGLRGEVRSEDEPWDLFGFLATSGCGRKRALITQAFRTFGEATATVIELCSNVCASHVSTADAISPCVCELEDVYATIHVHTLLCL